MFNLTVHLWEFIILSMRNRIFIFSLFMLVGISGLFAAELSGTYDKDFTVTTEFNTISKGKTLHVTKGATFIMTDAIVQGSIIVDKGCKFIAANDGAGYMVLSQGTHVEGIDLYYKVRVSDTLVFTRKIPMTLDEVWKSGNQQLIDFVSNIEFCYDSSLNGWISMNEIRFFNPFNENLYEDFDLIFTQSASQKLERECRSLIVKNKSKVVIQPDEASWGTKVNVSIIIESGSSLLGTDYNGHRLQIKKGIKIDGLPVFVRYDNEYISANSILSELWKLPVFSGDEYYILSYNPELKGWFFDNIILSDKELTDSLKKKLKSKRK